MNDEIDRLFAQVHGIEAQIEQRLDEQREQFRYRVAKGRAVFEAETGRLHRTLRASLPRYLWETPWRHLLVAPVIYAMVVPFALLDLVLTVYQHICFRAWGIARVVRRDYIVLDRHRLGYLNIIERLNCLFCSYANGLLGYAREIAGRTEQFWCPIRHATAIRGPHAHYKAFVDYGDAAGYRARLEELRTRLR
jgi:hypothetical protein